MYGLLVRRKQRDRGASVLCVESSVFGSFLKLKFFLDVLFGGDIFPLSAFVFQDIGRDSSEEQAKEGDARDEEVVDVAFLNVQVHEVLSDEVSLDQGDTKSGDQGDRLSNAATNGPTNFRADKADDEEDKEDAPDLDVERRLVKMLAFVFVVGVF